MLDSQIQSTRTGGSTSTRFQEAELGEERELGIVERPLVVLLATWDREAAVEGYH